jgi:hypothetical protein
LLYILTASINGNIKNFAYILPASVNQIKKIYFYILTAWVFSILPAGIHGNKKWRG